jgi:hypothetical protein
MRLAGSATCPASTPANCRLPWLLDTQQPHLPTGSKDQRDPTRNAGTHARRAVSRGALTGIRRACESANRHKPRREESRAYAAAARAATTTRAATTNNPHTRPTS